MTAVFTAKLARLVASLSRWLPEHIAKERANNIAAVFLVEADLLGLGEMTSDEVTPVEHAIRAALSRFQVSEDQITHAASAWREDPCPASPSPPS
jgi:hypothetical protein